MEFINKCKEGNLEFIKNNYKNYTNYYINKGFIELCKNGHLKVAKWLFKIKPDINISADNEEVFK